MKSLGERLIYLDAPERRPRRAAYALPSMFTAGNVYLGFYALLEIYQASMQLVQGIAGATDHFRTAAIAIGVAVFLDGLDGRIARMTNTTSEFGKELDSLADCISFGIAPALLAFAWGIQFVSVPAGSPFNVDQLRTAGYFFSFLYLMCGAARLARFNIMKNPMPSNPGRPDRKYFVGMPIPAAAAVVASVVYFMNSNPLRTWPWAVAWMGLLAVTSFLMVCTWRYPSFKDVTLTSPRSPLSFIVIGSFIYLIWNFSKPLLMVLSIAYLMSGMLTRLGSMIRRMTRPKVAA